MLDLCMFYQLAILSSGFLPVFAAEYELDILAYINTIYYIRH